MQRATWAADWRVVLPNRFRRAASGSIMQKKKPVRLDSRAGFRAVWWPDRVGLRVLHSFQRGGWVSDLGCMGVCCVCPGCRRAV